MLLTDEEETMKYTHQDSTNIWHTENTSITEGRGFLALLGWIGKSLPRMGYRKVLVLTNFRNCEKWLEMKLTASRACKVGGVVASAIQRKLEELKGINFECQYIPTKLRQQQENNENLLYRLVTACESSTLQTLEDMESEKNTITLPLVEKGLIYRKNMRNDESINALILRIDSRAEEIKYIEAKFAPHHLLVDLNARRFSKSPASIGMLKCVTGFNQYAIRDKLFNHNKHDTCDVCEERESWEHIIKCPCNRKHAQIFLQKLKTTLSKIKVPEVDFEIMTQNIQAYLLGDSKLNGTQLIFGYAQLFRGIIVRDWVSSNEQESKYGIYNKTIVKLCVEYYIQRWKARNERRNSRDVKRKILLAWFEEEVSDAKNLNHPEAQKFISIGANAVRKMSNDSIQKWLVQLHSFRKTASVRTSRDIRSFCIPCV